MAMIVRKTGTSIGGNIPYWCAYYLSDKGMGIRFVTTYTREHVCIDNTGHTFVLYNDYDSHYMTKVARLYNRNLSAYPSTLINNCWFYNAMYYDQDNGSIYIYSVPNNYDGTNWVYDYSTLVVIGCSIDDSNNAIPIYTIPIIKDVDLNYPQIFSVKSGTVTWVMLVDSVDEARKGAMHGNTILAMFAKTSDYRNWTSGDTISALTFNTIDAEEEGIVLLADPNSPGNIMFLHYPAKASSIYAGTSFENNGSFTLHKVDSSFNFTSETIPWEHNKTISDDYTNAYNTEIDCITFNDTVYVVWRRQDEKDTKNVVLLGTYDGTVWSAPSTVSYFEQSIDKVFSYNETRLYFETAYGYYNELQIKDNSIFVYRALVGYSDTFAHYFLVYYKSTLSDTLSWTYGTMVHSNTIDYGHINALPYNTVKLGCFSGYYGYLVMPCNTFNVAEPDTFTPYSIPLINTTLSINYDVKELPRVDATLSVKYNTEVLDWSNTIEVIFIEESGGEYTDLPIEVTVPYQTGMNSDFSDVRWLGSYGESIDFGIKTYVENDYCVFVILISIGAYGQTTAMVRYNNRGVTESSSIDYTSWIVSWYERNCIKLVPIYSTDSDCESVYTPVTEADTIPSWAEPYFGMYSDYWYLDYHFYTATRAYAGRVQINGVLVNWSTGACGGDVGETVEPYGIIPISGNQSDYVGLLNIGNGQENTIYADHYQSDNPGYMIAWRPVTMPTYVLFPY